MTLCCECGAGIAPGENFCGSCGARQQRDDIPVVAGHAAAGDDIEEVTEEHRGGVTDYSEHLSDGGSTWSSAATGGKKADEVAPNTGEVAASEELSSGTSRADGTQKKVTKPKALNEGKVLNSRYEIVRRIGGGGMGAVYLAKDRNLGEAARAVKEMIEAHIDD